jgi:integrase
MATLKLSDAKIKTLKPQEKIYRILDADRLYIEVRPTGVKVWRFKFVLDGKESSMSLGEYPAIGLADARNLREEMREKLSKGIHPVKERKNIKKAEQEKITNTFKSLTDEFVKERLSKRTEKYVQQFMRNMEKDAFPIIGSKDVREVTSGDVLQCIKHTMKRVKRQKNSGTGEVAAINTRKFIGAVMRYAIATLRADNDPTYAVRDVIARPAVNHARPLTKEEKKQARTKLESYRGAETVKNAGLILLYTMLRTIEIRRMEWSWVDFDDRVVNFPKSAMKKSRAHILPMSDQVFNVLQAQYLNSGHKDLVFPAVYKASGMLSQMTLNRMLEYIGLDEVTAHDFRATASTSLNEMGYDEKWIESQLAHADDNKTRASYNHAKYLQDRRKMIQDWANIVDSWKDLR